jgi:acyl-[acyl carrier protein]--UDP-N-acetylglucosamine O-acyltransferase
MKTHLHGGGQVAETAEVHETAFIGSDCKVLDNAKVGPGCSVTNNSVVYGNAAIYDHTSIADGAKVGGTAFLRLTRIHGDVVLEKTPITINGFDQQIVVAESFVIIGCQAIHMEDWRTRSVALLRANGFPKKSAERIRDCIEAAIECYRSLYHEDDIMQAFSNARGV